jgi:uncharacterized membrane protein
MSQIGKGLGKVVGWIAAIGLIALAVWAFVRGVDKDAAVVGTVFTAVVGLIIVVIQRDREKRQELETAHREQMSPILLAACGNNQRLSDILI